MNKFTEICMRSLRLEEKSCQNILELREEEEDDRAESYTGSTPKMNRNKRKLSGMRGL